MLRLSKLTDYAVVVLVRLGGSDTVQTSTGIAAATGIPVETSPAGRFTAARTFGPIDMPTWNSFSPRAGLVYDVFGNQKTAAKFSIGRYEQAGTTGFSESYNPLQLTTASVSWTDLNGDGVPQGELGCRSPSYP